MQLWKTLINEGNVEFSLQHYPRALESYQQALKHSHAVFVNHINRDSDQAIAIIIISYFNIADTQLELNDPKSAYSQYEKAFQFISTLQKFTDDERILESTFNASNQLHKQWLDCLQRYDDQLQTVSFSHWQTTQFFGKHKSLVCSSLKSKQVKVSNHSLNLNTHPQHVFH